MSLGLFHGLISDAQVMPGSMVLLGDSTSDGNTDTTAPVVPADTLDAFGIPGAPGVWSAITTQPIANSGNNWGGFAQPMAVAYKAATGRKFSVINCGSGGSGFSPYSGMVAGNTWAVSGNLWGNLEAKCDAALAAKGYNSPEIILISCGINDGRNASDVETNLPSLLDRLTAKWPKIKIYVVIPGRAESGYNYNDNGFENVRSRLVYEAFQRSNVCIVTSASKGIGKSGTYKPDLLHWTQSFYDEMARNVVNFHLDTAISNKWARYAINVGWDTLNTNRRTLFNDFFTKHDALGHLAKLEFLGWNKQGNSDNHFIDYSGKGWATFVGAPVHNANTSLGFNGSTSALATSYVNQWYNRSGADVDNVIFSAKLTTRASAVGSTVALFGRTGIGSSLLRVSQNATGVIYYGNVVGANGKQYATDNALLAGNSYGVKRTGGVNSLLKNGAVVDSQTIASAGAQDLAMVVGATGAGTLGAWLNGSIPWSYAANPNGFDHADFEADLNYMDAHWND